MPTDLVTTIEGLVVIFVVSTEYLRQRARIQVAAAAPPAPPAGPAVAKARSRRATRRPSVNQFFTVGDPVATVASAIQCAAPFLLAALGETMGQRSGVINLGVDGIMLLGAFGAYYTAARDRQPAASRRWSASASAR